MPIAQRRQPARGNGVKIDRANPLGRKVIEYLPLNGNLSATVSGAAITVGAGGSYKGSPNGVGLRGAGGGNRASLPMDLTKYSAVTIFFRMYWDAFANDDALAFEFTPTVFSNQGSFTFDPNSGGAPGRIEAFYAFTGAAASPNGTCSSNYPRPTGAAWHNYTLTLSINNTPTLYIDGALQSANNALVRAQAGTLGVGTLYLLSRAGSSLLATGNLQDLTFFDGALSAAEIASLNANLYQIVQPAPSFPYAAIAAAPATGTTVTATPGTLAASGLPASVSTATSIAGAVATLAASGQAATVSLPTAVAATVATSAAAGRTATVTLPTVIAAAAGASSASGLTATVSSGSAISASTGTVTAAGQFATIATQLNIAATPGASIAAGLSATIVSGAAIVASVATVTAAGLSATLVSTTTINATCGTGAASGLLASIQSGAAISATTGQIIATGRTASIVSGVSINCGVGVASAAGRAAFIPVATLVSCISGAATTVGLTASIALDRPAPLPNRHNLYSGLPRNRAYLGAARNRNYKGQP